MKIIINILILFVVFLVFSCKEDEDVRMSKCDILSVKSNAQGDTINIGNVIINGKYQITVKLPSSSDLKNTILKVQVSEKATISPNPDTIKNYTLPKEFIVKAENGESKIYVIRASRISCSGNDILSITSTNNNIDYEIGGLKDTIYSIKICAYGITDITKLKLQFNLSEKATILPCVDTLNKYKSFLYSMKIKVTSENGKSRKYIVKLFSPEILLSQLLIESVSLDYQRNYSLYDDAYAQYFANSVKGFKSENYEFRNDWVGCAWKQFYYERMKDYYGIKDNFNSERFKNMRASTEIYMCFLWQRITDRWGDIPYTTKKYITQKEVYIDLMKRVKSACESINVSDASQYNIKSNDLLYKGDYNKWKKFGYSLLLRMAMRVSNTDLKSIAQQYAEAAVLGGVFTSNADNAWINQDANNWYDYLNNTLINWQGGTISKSFCDHLKESSSGLDPRASKWARTGNLGYVGFRNGTMDYNYPSDFKWENYANINQDAYFRPGRIGGVGTAYSYPIMNYSEVLFLQAEGKLRNWNTGGNTTKDYYEEGIKASMEEVGVYSTDANIYINGLPVLTGTQESQFKILMTQKWLALFPNGIEGWAEFRRTGYPLTFQDYVDVSPKATVANGNWVGRLRYPDIEHDLNSSNFPFEYNTYEKDRMDKAVWWGQKNNGGFFPNTMIPVNF